jgi:hypothetical protein
VFECTADFTTGDLAGQSFQGTLSVDGDDCPGGICDGSFAPSGPGNLLSFDITIDGVRLASPTIDTSRRGYFLRSPSLRQCVVDRVRYLQCKSVAFSTASCATRSVGWLGAEYDTIPIEREVLGDRELAGTIVRLPMVYGPRDPLHRFDPLVKRIVNGRRFDYPFEEEALRNAS